MSEKKASSRDRGWPAPVWNEHAQVQDARVLALLYLLRKNLPHEKAEVEDWSELVAVIKEQVMPAKTYDQLILSINEIKLKIGKQLPWITKYLDLSISHQIEAERMVLAGWPGKAHLSWQQGYRVRRSWQGTWALSQGLQTVKEGFPSEDEAWIWLKQGAQPNNDPLDQTMAKNILESFHFNQVSLAFKCHQTDLYTLQKALEWFSLYIGGAPNVSLNQFISLELGAIPLLESFQWNSKNKTIFTSAKRSGETFCRSWARAFLNLSLLEAPDGASKDEKSLAWFNFWNACWGSLSSSVKADALVSPSQLLLGKPETSFARLLGSQTKQAGKKLLISDVFALAFEGYIYDLSVEDRVNYPSICGLFPTNLDNLATEKEKHSIKQAIGEILEAYSMLSKPHYVQEGKITL